jgi:hypothetical protein
LRYVRLGDFADVEAVAALPQPFMQHHDVTLVELECRGVTQQIHIRRRALQQQVQLGQTQRLSSGRDLALGLPRPVGRLARKRNSC